MSSGYNYLALNDDVYMYTGVTSISSDQSIIGFVLSDLRTKETKYYQVSGALEMTAQTSAEGAVQAVFPYFGYLPASAQHQRRADILYGSQGFKRACKDVRHG